MREFAWFVILVIFLCFSAGWKGEKACDKSGGDYVRGVFWFKCVDKKGLLK